MITKFRLLILSLGLFATVSLSQAQVPAGWNHMGVITNIFVGTGYGNTTPSTAKLLFTTADGGAYYFALSSTEQIRVWTSEILAAKANGQTVTVATSGSTESGMNGFVIPVKIWVK